MEAEELLPRAFASHPSEGIQARYSIAYLPLIVSLLLAMCWTTVAQATTVNLSPDSVNRIIGGDADNHFDDFFSTHFGGSQTTLVETTNTSFLDALEATLGALGTGEEYLITSASLVVGSAFDNYATTGAANAHVVLTAWDSSDVTFNEADADLNVNWAIPGLFSGTDYTAVAADTGIVTTFETTWASLDPTVNDWLSGSVSNNGLYFPDIGGASGAEFTAAGNVSWTLEASIVPEPSTGLLFASGLLLLAARRKRFPR